MNTSEVLRITGIPRDKLYYLERAGYIRPHRIPRGELSGRQYENEEVKLIGLIWENLKAGFRHKVAIERALATLRDGQQLNIAGLK